MAEIEEKLQLVTFQLGTEQYGIDIMDVKEIYGVQDVRPIPNAPSYVEGIFNLRGSIIPIINPHKRFRINKAVLTAEEALLSGFIIIRLDGKQIGLMIDKVLRVVSIDHEEIQPPPQVISGIGAEYIQGVVKNDDGYLIILNINRLFDPEELKRIDNLY